MECYWVSAEVQEKKHELEGIVTDYKYGFKTDYKNLKDTGKGIRQEDLEHLFFFYPFFIGSAYWGHSITISQLTCLLE